MRPEVKAIVVTCVAVLLLTGCGTLAQPERRISLADLPVTRAMRWHVLTAAATLYYEKLALDPLAEPLYAHAIDAWPENPQGYINLARFYDERNEVDNARHIVALAKQRGVILNFDVRRR